MNRFSYKYYTSLPLVLKGINKEKNNENVIFIISNITYYESLSNVSNYIAIKDLMKDRRLEVHYCYTDLINLVDREKSEIFMAKQYENSMHPDNTILITESSLIDFAKQFFPEDSVESL